MQGLLGIEYRSSVEGWLQRLPWTLIWEHPGLLLAHSWTLFFRSRFEALAAALERVDVLLSQPQGARASSESALLGSVAIFRAFLALTRFEVSAVFDYAREAYRLLPPGCLYERGHIVGFNAMAQQLAGRGGEAERRLAAELASERVPQPVYRARLLIALCYVHWANVDFPKFELAARQLLALAERHELAVSRAWAHCALGVVHWSLDRTDAALEHFAAAIELRDRSNALTTQVSRLGLALAAEAEGRGRVADEVLAEALELAEQTQNQRSLVEVRSLQARLALGRGKVDLAERLLQGLEIADAPLHIFAAIEVPALTRARVLLEKGDRTSLESAVDLLDRQARLYSGVHDRWRVVQARTLQAVGEDRLGRRDEALHTLTEALELAEHGGTVRTFTEQGVSIAPLLERLAGDGPTAAYAGRLAKCLRSTQAERQTQPPPPHRDLIESLTWREMEVLRLLAGRLSNKEISEELVISTETVKKHATSIYGKLGVNGRRSAVSRAQELGLV
jgi:LuxR family maltose regulon positive regulatory protein